MRIIETASLDFTSTLSVNEREWIYNGFDAAVTHEIRDTLLPYFDDVSRKTYEFSKALQAPIIEMSLRGLLVDPTEKLRTLTAIRKDIAFLEDRLFTLIEEGIGTRPSSPTWWRSPTQLAAILYTVIGLKPVLKRNARGQMAPTTNRDAIEKLSINFIAEPICNHILILRDLDKKRSFLETGIDPDGRYRYGFNIAGTNTGRLSSSASDFGTGSNAQNIGRSLRHIFIADPGMKFGNLDLEQADSRNLGAMCWNLFYDQMGDSAGKYLDACESGDLHTFVCRMANTQLPWPEDKKGWRAIADQIAYRDFTYRDMSKRLGHGCLTEDHEVLTREGWVKISDKPSEIMTWTPNETKFDSVSNWVDKPYTGTMHRYSTNSYDAYMTHDHRVPYRLDPRSPYYVGPAEAGPKGHLPLGANWIGGTEVVPAKLIAAFMADGYEEKNWMSFHFHKERKVKRLIALCNEYGYTYKIHGDKVRVRGLLPKLAGAFMLNWTRQCLVEFIQELQYWDGHKSATAVSIHSTKRDQLEWFQTLGRLVGVGGNIHKPKVSGFGSVVYTLQQNNRQYASARSMYHERHVVENLRVLCPTVPSGFFYVRRNGKIFVTGNTNYYGTAPTMARNTKVPLPQVKEFQSAYFRGFPEIPAYHQWVKDQLKGPSHIVTPYGFRRFFFGRHTDDSTIREAIACGPQSMTASEINIGLMNVWRANRVQLLVQVHDSLLFQYPEDQEDEIIPWALEALRAPLLLKGGREFCVPTEAKVGWNWGDVVNWTKADAARGLCSIDQIGTAKENPDGLIKYKGTDKRRRAYRPRLSVRNF